MPRALRKHNQNFIRAACAKKSKSEFSQEAKLTVLRAIHTKKNNDDGYNGDDNDNYTIIIVGVWATLSN